METFKFSCPHCNTIIEADEAWIGQISNCPSCNEEICIEKSELDVQFHEKINIEKKETKVQFHNTMNSNQQKTTNTVKEKNSKMKEYKVLTQKDKWFSGKFDPDMLEKAINAYAQQGWRVISAATGSFPGFIGGNRDEMVIILERDK